MPEPGRGNFIYDKTVKRPVYNKGDSNLETDSFILVIFDLFPYNCCVISVQSSKSAINCRSNSFATSGSYMKAFVSKFKSKLLTSILAVPVDDTKESIIISLLWINPFSYL